MRAAQKIEGVLRGVNVGFVGYVRIYVFVGRQRAQIAEIGHSNNF